MAVAEARHFSCDHLSACSGFNELWSRGITDWRLLAANLARRITGYELRRRECTLGRPGRNAFGIHASRPASLAAAPDRRHPVCSMAASLRLLCRLRGEFHRSEIKDQNSDKFTHYSLLIKIPVTRNLVDQLW